MENNEPLDDDTAFPFVGREKALARLREHLRSVTAGAGGSVVVEGTAGIGKSRLLDTAAALAARSGIAVAHGSATEIDRVAPLTTLLTALYDLDDAHLQMPGLTRRGQNRLWLIDRLSHAIEDYVRHRRLLIVIDDAQWADELSALAIRVLIPALAASPVLWLLGRRPNPARNSAQDSIDWLLEGHAQRLHLDPLSEEEMRRLCARVLPSPPGESVMAMARRTEGNPFLLRELLTRLRDTSQTTPHGGTEPAVASGPPSEFLDAVDSRLRDLSPDARRLLDAGSVFDRPFTVHEVAKLVGASAIDLVPTVDEAVTAGVLVDQGSCLAFRHDLLREAVYHRLSGPVRLVLHREAAEVIQEEGRGSAEAAEHLVHGHVRDERAVTLVREAIDQVAPSAPGTAADLVLRFLDLLDEYDPNRPSLAADAVRLLACAGRVTEASEIGGNALRAGLEPASEAALLLGLAEALKHCGHNHQAVEHTRRALERPAVPDRVRAQLLSIQAHGLLYLADLTAADRAGAEAVRLGEHTGEDQARVFGLAARSVVARSRGAIDEALEHAHEAVRLAESAGGEARHRHPRLWLATALTALDRFTEADSVFEIGQREANELGTAWSQPLWHYYRAELRLSAGRLDDAKAEAEAGVRFAEQLSALALAVPLLATLGHVAMRQDDLDVAQRYLHRATKLVEDGVSVGPGDLTWKVATLQASTGRYRDALETLAEVYGSMPERMLLLVQEPQAGAQLVHIARSCADTEKAEAVAGAIADLAHRNPSVMSLAGAARHAEGVLRDDRVALREAVDAYRQAPRPLARAAALEDAGLAERAAGDRKTAVALLHEAHEHYAACGATRDTQRVRNALTTMNARRKAPKVETPASPWDSLTKSELQVVRLVAEGLTNREVADRLFLSPHTVDSHLRHSFTKLGINKRVELTREAMKHERAD